MQIKSKVSKIMVLILAMTLVLTWFSGCSQNAENSYKAGTYTAEVDGHNGTITIDVTFSESKITDIAVKDQSETSGLGDAALEQVSENILSEQSLKIDTVSGATVSSSAMLAAVEDCVVQAGGDLSMLKSGNKDSATAETKKLEADIVVVGAGASGISAAISAADMGAKVILIEKTGVIGGASNLSWAGKFVDSSVAIENGLKVDQEKMITDWIENNHWRVDSAAIRQYVAKSGETYDWLAEKGYVTQFINFAGEQLHMLPDYGTREASYKRMLAESVESNGGKVFTQTTGKNLIVNEDGEVTGIVAEQNDGTILEITADSVIIATGGYAANAEMVKENFGFEGINGGLGQNVGEGLEMAWEAGAKIPDNLGGQMLHQTLARATSNLKKEYEGFKASYPMMLTYMPTLMNVNTSGARFRDEAFTLKAVAAANSSAFNGPYHMVVISKAQIDALAEEGLNGIEAPGMPGMPPEFYLDFIDEFTIDNPWKDADEIFDKMVENGDGFKGDTIEELAKNAGMDEKVFVDAFNQYQEACETGLDTAFGKSSDFLVSYGDEGPYYAIIAEINNLGSVGGLLVNTKFQVLDDDRVPVKGLYAVGLESEGVLFNDTYVGNGVGIGYAFTSGRLGGESAATEVLEK
ncbi:FAD-dependent oxidoreductase [Alkalibacter mobilis]|uniref:FAD-dependent oxidoreductase n=1 Tax=Alkalibacter mobilis TaxID=2787712 RepID=UPI00189C6C46|nr:FAD-dependent oxidoreductase [Alkalibacter mobilis]MBF7097426.1 FAD-binding protein [Alkalibacter mobilis]